MKLQNQRPISAIDKKTLPSTAKLRPSTKINNLSVRENTKINNLSVRENTSLQMEYNEFQLQKSSKENEKETYIRLRRLYAEGTRRMKNYQIPEALENFKNYIHNLVKEFGRDYAPFIKDFRQIIENVSGYALRAQQDSGNAELALMILMWAEDLTNPVFQFEEVPICRCLVYNNLGCVYRRCGKLQAALSSLERALEIVQTFGDIVPRKSITYLNITAVLSQMGVHERALEYAYLAIKECQTELALFLRDSESETDDAAYTEKLKYVGIAMHNVAVEEECCGQLETACNWYQKSYQQMMDHFGPNDQTTIKFLDFLEKAKKKAEHAINDSRNKLAKQLYPRPGNGSQIIQQKTLHKIGNRQLIRPDSQKTLDKQDSQKSLLRPESQKTFYFRQQQQQQSLVQSQTTPNLFNIRTVQKPMELKKQYETARQPNSRDIEPQQQQIPKQKQIVDLKQMAVLDWSEEESVANEEEEEKEEIELELQKQQKQIQLQVPQVSESEQKESRINFLQKMTIGQSEDNIRKQKEQALKKQQEEEAEKLRKQAEASKKLAQVVVNIMGVELEEDTLSNKEQIRMAIIIQSYIKMKLQVIKYRRLKEEHAHELKQKQYTNSLIKIQRWIRLHIFSQRLRSETRKKIQSIKCIRWPRKEIRAAQKIQSLARRFLVRMLMIYQKQSLKKWGYVIRQSQFEPTFLDDFGHVMYHKLFQNRKFWFRISILKNNIEVALLPYDKRKTMKIFKKGFRLHFEISQFCRILVMLDQYIDFQHNSVAEDTSVTHDIEQIQQSALYIMQPIQTEDQCIQYKWFNDSPLVFQNFLLIIGGLLQRLVRMEENVFKLLGFTDFVYNYRFVPPDLEVDPNRQPALWDLSNVSPRMINQIISIQTQFRGSISRRMSKIQKSRNLISYSVRQFQLSGQNKKIELPKSAQVLLMQFVVSGMVEGIKNREYFHVFIVKEEGRLQPLVFCRRSANKRKSNKLEIRDLVTKQIGYPSQESFFELYTVTITSTGIRLNWSDESKYWLMREGESGSSKKKITLRRMNQAASTIQKEFKRILEQSNFTILQEAIQRQKKKLKTGICLSLVRKVIIQTTENNVRKAYYMNFFLLTETINTKILIEPESSRDHSVSQGQSEIQDDSDQTSSQEINGSSQFAPNQPFKRRQIMNFMHSSSNANANDIKERQSIQIYCKQLERDQTSQNIPPFSQELFYHIKIQEIIGIAHMMMEKARVVKNRHGLYYLKVINLETLQGMIINQQRQLLGQVQRDETLEARRIFNVNVQRKKWLFGNTNAFSYVPTHLMQNQVDHSGCDISNIKVFIDKIAHAWSIMRQRVFKWVSAPKDIKYQNLDSIADYVRKVQCKSDYGYGEDDPMEGAHNIDFLNERADEERIAQEKEYRAHQFEKDEKMRLERAEAERRAHIQATQIPIFEDYRLISNERVFVSVIFNKVFEQLFVTVSRKSTNAELDDSQQDDFINLSINIDVLILVPGAVLTLGFIKDQIENLVLKYLFMDFDGLYFVPEDQIQNQLHEQFLLYQEAEQNRINKANQGQLNIVSIMKLRENASKRSCDILMENGQQMVIMQEFIKNIIFETEYIFNLCDDSIILTIYLRSDQKIRKFYIIRMKDLDCDLFIKDFPKKTPQEITIFLKAFVCQIEKCLQVSQEQRLIVTNFQEIRKYLPTIFREQYVLVMQKKRRVLICDMNKLFIAPKFQQNEHTVYLYRHITHFEGRYIEIKFYLVKEAYMIRFSLRECNTIDGNGNVVPKLRVPDPENDRTVFLNIHSYQLDLLALINRSFLDQLIPSLNPQQMMDWKRIDPYQWIQLDMSYGKQYYQSLYNPLIRLILSSMKLQYPSTSLLRVSFQNLNPVIKKIKGNENEGSMLRFTSSQIYDGDSLFYVMISASIRVQGCYKRMKQREWFQMRIERKLQIELKRKRIGQLVKKSIRQIDGKLYIVVIYLLTENQQKTFTFDLIPYTNKLIDRRILKNRLRGQFHCDTTELFNTGSMTFYEYLIGLIYVSNGSVKVRDQKFGIYGATEKIVMPLLEKASKSHIEYKQPQTFLDQLIGPSQLVHHHESGMETNGFDTVYNVVYSGHTKLHAKRIGQLEENTVELLVNLDKLRKLYPSLNTHDGDVMKLIGMQLIEGIRTNNTGQLLIDNSKINPSFLTIHEQKLSQNPLQMAQNHNEEREQHIQILVKKTLQFQRNKYLVVVNHIERKITKIEPQRVDQVFEEYESIYQITSTSLSNYQSLPLKWEFSPGEAEILTHQKNKFQVAHQILKRLIVTQVKFIYLTFNLEDSHRIRTQFLNVNIFLYLPQVILLSEAAIVPLQYKIKNRVFLKNYNSYRFILKSFKDGKWKFRSDVLSFSVENLQNQGQFIVLCYEDRSKRLQYMAWSIYSFEQYEIEIPKKHVINILSLQFQKYQILLQKDKLVTLKILSKFVEFSPLLNSLYFAPPDLLVIMDLFNDATVPFKVTKTRQSTNQ